MWKNNCFVSYLHAARRTEAFFFGILILEGAVYSLYGLPWGPAVYTKLLSTAFFLLVWGTGKAETRGCLLYTLEPPDQDAGICDGAFAAGRGAGQRGHAP